MQFPAKWSPIRYESPKRAGPVLERILSGAKLLSSAAPLVALWLGLGGDARGQDLPSFAELEAAGTRIGDIKVSARDIFDTTDAREDYLLYRWANKLHIQTRPDVIQRALLFRSGEPVSVARIEETERSLLDNKYLYEVLIRPVAVHDGVVDVEVITRDTWSLDPGFSAGRSGGSNSSGIHLKEYNLLGSGVALLFSRSTDVDRTSNEFQISDEHAFGTWTTLRYSHQNNSDGSKNDYVVDHPFYALDTRWAGGFQATTDNRIDSVYNAGLLSSQYRHRQDKAEVYGGWSVGRVDGWVQRYSLGVDWQDDQYAVEPGLMAPSQLPENEKLVAPFVKYELIEDRFERQLNRNLIGRPEFFALGLSSTVKLGWAATAFGSTRDTLLYSASISRGFEGSGDEMLTLAATLDGRYVDGSTERQQFGLKSAYYLPQGRRWLFYAGGSADVLTRPDPTQSLMLGGDNGLRGYPLRYQSGTHRVLVTLEERAYSDWYVYRLFRVGGAAFFDVGRAWGGDNTNQSNPGWLSDIGAGLRIFNTRSAFSNVLHIDVAVPLNATPDIKKVQFLVKTKTSF
jgi:outer membrane protein assembly factor BamA